MKSCRLQCWFFGAVAALGATLGLARNAEAQIIADHTALAKFGDVTADCVAKIKSSLRLSYGHTSHGSQITTGLEVLAGANALYKFDSDRSYYESGNGSPVPADTLSFWDSFPGYEASDLGNPDRTTWATATERMLSNSGSDFTVFPHLRNVVVWSWCGQVSSSSEADIDTYTGLMSGLEAKYTDVHFVYMTGHLDGSGEAGNLNQRNNQIRNFVKQSPSRILFDFADIESYDPDGTYFLDKGADDGCGFDSGNWADNWCAAHTGHELCANCDCAHSQPLNCNVKARVFWWLLSQVAECTNADSGAGGSGGSGAGGSGTGGSGTGGSGTGGSGTGGSGTGGASVGGAAGAGTGGVSTGGAAGAKGGGAGKAGTGGAAGSTLPLDGGADAATPPAAAPEDDGGCSCSLVGTVSGPSTALLFALIPLFLRRRRRPS